jgi:hypothetical protein
LATGILLVAFYFVNRSDQDPSPACANQYSNFSKQLIDIIVL